MVFEDCFRYLIQCCPLELSVMMKMSYVCITQFNSHKPHVVNEQSMGNFVFFPLFFSPCETKNTLVKNKEHISG